MRTEKGRLMMRHLKPESLQYKLTERTLAERAASRKAQGNSEPWGIARRPVQIGRRGAPTVGSMVMGKHLALTDGLTHNGGFGAAE